MGAPIPKQLEEEETLDVEHAPRFVTKCLNDLFENGLNAPLVVLLGGQQPVRIPMARLAENKDAARVVRDSQSRAELVFSFRSNFHRGGSHEEWQGG